MFTEVIILFAVVSIVVAPLAMFMSFCDWAHDNHRVPFFVKWYRAWSRNKGERIVADAKKTVR